MVRLTLTCLTVFFAAYLAGRALAVRPSPLAAPALRSDDPAATERGVAIIRRAIARGAWTADDRLALRIALIAVPEASKDAILRRFLAALDGGELRIEIRPAL